MSKLYRKMIVGLYKITQISHLKHYLKYGRIVQLESSCPRTGKSAVQASITASCHTSYANEIQMNRGDNKQTLLNCA